VRSSGASLYLTGDGCGAAVSVTWSDASSTEEGHVLIEKSFDTGELTLNYAEGPPAGPPLVLLHGLTARWQAWQAMLPLLTPHWQVYALDARGHGASGRVAHQYHLADYARDVAAFLHHLPEPAVVMGHSLGAATALAAAAACPTRTRAAVLLDPPLFNRDTSIAAMPEVKNWFNWVYQTVTASSSYEDIVARCRESDSEATAEQITVFADTVSGVASDTVYTALQDQLFAGFDLAGALRQIQCPLLLLYGDWAHGAAVRDEDAAFVRDNLPSAVIVKIPDGSHMFFQEQQEQVVEQVGTFVASLRPPGSRRAAASPTGQTP